MKEDRIEEEEQDVEIKTIKPSSLLKILLADNHKIRANKESDNKTPNQSTETPNVKIDIKKKFCDELDEIGQIQNGYFIK